MSINTRPTAVAGLFYPANAAELRHDVVHYLEHASVLQNSDEPVKAIIAPHAGYIYSGPIAANAYIQLQKTANSIERVILLGPCHRVPVSGIASSSASYFATPLGNVPVDRSLTQQLETLPQVNCNDAAHEQEHSLEVHLPFLQVMLDEFTLVPLVVGECSATDVAQVLKMAWGGSETVIVVSSDLSHFHDYQTAKEIDKQTSQAIEQLKPDSISSNGACGSYPIKGLLNLAREIGLQVTTLDVRNSGDTAGDKSQVVGYGAYSLQ
ncbi:MAG: AmmeMemoRadiSam system protein B [Gammaproteobacteria bacterium]